jgi:hypothetical protein
MAQLSCAADIRESLSRVFASALHSNPSAFLTSFHIVGFRTVPY